MTSAKRDKTLNAEDLFLEAEQYEEKGDFESAFDHSPGRCRIRPSHESAQSWQLLCIGKRHKEELKKAAHWYKKAYKNGNNDGALNLAIDRRNEGNVRSAVVWFKKAIAMNSGEACIELAKIYKARKGRRKARSQPVEASAANGQR